MPLYEGPLSLPAAIPDGVPGLALLRRQREWEVALGAEDPLVLSTAEDRPARLPVLAS